VHRHLTVALPVAAAVAMLFAPSGESKFDISFTFEPTHPIARHDVGLTMRTDVVLPRKQSMRLIAVGPWREQFGQTVLDIQLVRVGPRAFRARYRFPHSGRWSLTVLHSGAPGSVPLPPNGVLVTVRPPR
jgi:hypothetical protein